MFASLVYDVLLNKCTLNKRDIESCSLKLIFKNLQLNLYNDDLKTATNNKLKTKEILFNFKTSVNFHIKRFNLLKCRIIIQ